MPLRVKVGCRQDFEDYQYICKKFTYAVSRIRKLTDRAKLKDELLVKLEDCAKFFKSKELEIMFYLNDEADWKFVRAQFASTPGQKKNRVKLREEKLVSSSPVESKVTWRLLQRDMVMSVQNKTFVCVLVSSDQEKLADVARVLCQSTHTGKEMYHKIGILFYNNGTNETFNLSEIMDLGEQNPQVHTSTEMDCGIAFTEQSFPVLKKKDVLGELHASAETDSLYARVEAVLKERIESGLQLMLEFLQSHLPSSEGEFVDVYDLDQLGLPNVAGIKGLWKIMFEVFTWIRYRNVHVGRKVSEMPKLRDELKEDLLSVEGVEGCGVIWGRLTIHVAADRQTEISQLVPNILLKHDYSAKYRVRVLLERELHGRKILPGCEIQTELTEVGKQEVCKKQNKIYDRDNRLYRSGTLGCFVYGKKLPTNQKPAQNGLYGVTCAHCLKHCEGEIMEVDSMNEFTNIGHARRAFVLYTGDFGVDIAAFKVDRQVEKDCIVKLNHNQAVSSYSRWNFYEGDEESLVGIRVFKRGSETQLTWGEVTGISYMKCNIPNVESGGTTPAIVCHIFIEGVPRIEEMPSPRNVRVARTSQNTVKVAWDDPPENNQIQGYRVHYRNIDHSPDTWSQKDIDGSSTQVIIDHLKPRDWYDIRVQAISVDGKCSDLTPAATVDHIPKDPPVPQNVRVTRVSTTVQVTWDKPPENSRVDKYQVWFCYNALCPREMWRCVYTDGPTTQHNISNLKCSVSYAIRVQALMDGKWTSLTDVAIVDPMPNDSAVFSKDGDSGAAVCTELPDGSTQVIGMLQGSRTELNSSGNSTSAFTIAGHMRECLNMLGEFAKFQFSVPAQNF